jgi:hypothetical protein
MIRTTSTYDPDALYEHFAQRAAQGLQRIAPQIEDALANTRAHGDVTGATRDGYRCYVVGGSLVNQASALAALNSAVAAVDRLNPGHSATASWPIPARSIGLALTSPTDYQVKLETENAGQKATLGPTLRQYLAQILRAAAGKS